MYETEKIIHEKLEGTKSTLKLVNAFTFELPEPDENNEKESQYYFIFEQFKHTLLQKISLKSNPTSTSDQTNYFTEQEMRQVTSTLIQAFADLQRQRIAHRNIKPANIVSMSSSYDDLRICNFELAKILSDSDMIDLHIDTCSIVYASPLVLESLKNEQKQVQLYNPFKEDVYSLGLTLL